MKTIDYSTPKQRTNQQAFDIAATHLLKQGVRSMRGETCVYRGPDGTMCAVGVLIPDSIYRPDWEGVSAKTLYTFPACAPYLPPSRLLATALQAVHDIANPKDWREKLRKLAKEFGLDAGVLSQ